MRLVLVIGMTIGAAAAHAAGSDDAAEKALTRLAIAHVCAPVLNNSAPFEWAKRHAVGLVGEEKAEALIKIAEQQPPPTNPPPETVCRASTKNFHD